MLNIDTGDPLCCKLIRIVNAVEGAQEILSLKALVFCSGLVLFVRLVKKNVFHHLVTCPAHLINPDLITIRAVGEGTTVALVMTSLSLYG